MSQTKQISLEDINSDPNLQKCPLTSPRSLYACKRQGILASELVPRSPQELRELYKNDISSEEDLNAVAQRYEEKRLEKIKVLFQERNEIIEAEKNGNMSRYRSGGNVGSQQTKSKEKSLTGGGSSSLIEAEKRQLEKIKQRQKKEIEQMMDYEMKMQTIREQNEEKFRQAKEREKEREKDLLRRKKEVDFEIDSADEEKFRKEQERKKKEEEEAELNKRRAEELFKKVNTSLYAQEQERAQAEREKELVRRKEAQLREEQQKLKQEQYRLQTEEIMKKQLSLLESKKREMDEKDQKRREVMQYQQAEKIKESQKKRAYHEEKIKVALEKNETELFRKRENFEQRQEITEQKRRSFEAQRLSKKEETRMKSVQKQAMIEKVLQTNNEKEEQKRQNYYYRQGLIEQRKRIIEEEQKELIEKKKRELQLKEEQRKNVKLNNEKQLEEKTSYYVSKLEEADAKVTTVKQRLDSEMRQKHIADLLKRIDKRENVERMARIQDFEKEQVMEKIRMDSVRADQLRREKDLLLETRVLMKKEIDLNKQDILDKFDKVKKGKMDANSLVKEYGLSPIHSSDQKKSESTKTFSHIVRPQKVIGSSNSKGIAKKANNSYSFLPEIRKPSGHEPQPKSSTVKTNNMRAAPGSEIDKKKQLNELKMRLNNEMLVVLEEEQNKEIERDQLLEGCQDLDKKKDLEKKFGIDRALSQKRIQELSDKHDKEIESFMVQNRIRR